MEKEINADSTFEKIGEAKISYYLTGNTTGGKNDTSPAFLNKLKSLQMSNLNWNYVKNNDTLFISNILMNYINSLNFIFNEADK